MADANRNKRGLAGRTLLLATACALAGAGGLSSSAQTLRDAATGHSYNTKFWYADQLPSWIRQEGLRFNGVDQRAVIASDASTITLGQSAATLGIAGADGFRIRMLINIFGDAPNTAQTLVMVGGDTHGWGIGRSPDGTVFLALRNGGAASHVVGCPFPIDGQMHEAIFELNDATASITIDGVVQAAAHVFEGGAPTLDQDVTQGAAIGNRAPFSDNLFFHILANAADPAAFEAVMGPAAAYPTATADQWFDGGISYLSVTRGGGATPQNEWLLVEGADVPGGTPPMESNNADWGIVPDDSFLFHWPLSSLDYDLGSTGGVSPTIAPIVGTGPLGLSSWSDDGPFGMPVMADGPLGVAARTQVQNPSSHSELFMATPLYNVDQYYLSWTGYIDSSTFFIPGEFLGSARLNRLSNGDSPAGAPAALLLESEAAGVNLSLFGQDVNEIIIPNPLPFDSPYRILLHYLPRTEGVPDTGMVRLSFDGGDTWVYTVSHDRVDNYHYRVGWRTNNFFGGRHWIRDLAYGSDLNEVWSTTAPGDADLNGDGVVDGTDLAALLSVWGTSGGDADLTCDGVVDGADLAAMLSQWDN